MSEVEELVERCVKATYEQFAKERGTMPDPYEAARICIRLTREHDAATIARLSEEIARLKRELANLPENYETIPDKLRRLRALAEPSMTQGDTTND